MSGLLRIRRLNLAGPVLRAVNALARGCAGQSTTEIALVLPEGVAEAHATIDSTRVAVATSAGVLSDR